MTKVTTYTHDHIMSQHNPMTTLHRFQIANMVLEVIQRAPENKHAVEMACNAFRRSMGGDSLNWDNSKIITVCENIVGLG